MYKQIAIATLIAAPLLASMASRFTPHPAAPTATDAAAPAPPPELPAAKPAKGNAPMTYSAIPQQGQSMAPAGPVNPTPTLDPNAVAAAVNQPADPIRLASPALPPVPKDFGGQAPHMDMPPVNPIGPITPITIREPRY